MAFTRLEPTGVNTSATFTFANANVTTNLNVGGVSNLGPVGNIIITGGTSGYVLSTDGSGTLSWVAQSGGGGTNYSNSNVAAYLPTFTGNISANYFIGNGSTLTNITGANVSGQVSFAATANSVAGGNVSGQVGNALIAGTVYTNAQPNITSVGTLASLNVTANVSSGNILTNNLLYANGSPWVFNNYSNTNVAAYLPTYAGNIGADTITATGNIKGIYLQSTNSSGDEGGEMLLAKPQTNSTIAGTGITIDIYQNRLRFFEQGGSARGAFIDITAASAGVGSNLLAGGGSTTNPAGSDTQIQFNNLGSFGADANFTYNSSTDTLGVKNVTMESTGALSGGNSISATYVIGNGSLLTSITGGNVTGQVANALVAGTVYTAAQPSITSVGTLTSLSVTGNISTAGNVIGGNAVVANYFVGNGSTLSSISGSNVTGQVSNALVAGTVYTNAQPNITSTGTLSSVSISGLTTATGGLKTGNIQDTGGTNTISVSSTTVGVIGNLTVGTGGTGNLTATYIIGNGSSLTSITGGNVTGQVSNALVAGTVYTNAQPNITSVGILSALSVSGNISTGNLLTDNLLYANGVAWSFGGSSYSNANVAAYLPTYTGNVSANYFIGNALSVGSGSGGTISGANSITSNYISVSTSLSLTGTSTFALSSDRTTYVSGSTSGTYTADTSAAGPVWYFTTIAGATTLNFTNLPTTDGYTSVLVAMFASTTTVPAVQIAGSAQTIKWISGAAPTGNASGINIYTFSCVRVNSAWTAVLGSYSYYA